jgi:autotransporter-associated beta strand protein
MRKGVFLLLLLMISINMTAQRKTDQLGRGLVVVQTDSTSGSEINMIGWRRLANEYYDVTYNLYKDGQLLASGLTTTTYNDSINATNDNVYAVSVVVNGQEQTRSSDMKAWSHYVYKYQIPCPTGYLDIPLDSVYDRTGNDVTGHYIPNDAEMADLDGDGELEMIIKRLNTVDANSVYPQSSNEFVVLDAYDINWQKGDAKLMWRIDCGPNMVSLNSTEINIIAYDWDEDGKAEVVLRGADNMIVYGTDGKTPLYTIGNMWVNTRNTFDPNNGAQFAWTHTGAEYLIYMNGKTGELYQQTEYPLKRLEYASTLSEEWGGRGYGHNSSKYFFGAPFLDGSKASLFLARGIYGTHKMIAMDLNRKTHQWSQRWRWNCTNTSSAWYGNGYHNFVIADVDEDGRDEIVYGSMVIDDNGCGLSTSGYEHGDAQHVSDFDPWRRGLEFFGCLENAPVFGCNYRNATTSEIYYRKKADKDDGRALMANFSDNYPGSLGRSAGTPMMSGITDNTVDALSGDDFIKWSDLNFRIYWDGDLCSEILNSPSKEGYPKVDKPGVGRLFNAIGCNMNNDSKNNACFQGDIIGDWREEIIVRCGKNVRVYTSGMDTQYSLPCLWFDHQYRQAMVWQMMAYNQPPHLSYFLGNMEGYTQAPPPLTNEGRTEISNGGTIGTDMNGKHVMTCASDNITVNVDANVAPWVFTDNAPSWVQGTDQNGTSATKVRNDQQIIVTNLPPINRTYYTHTVTGNGFTGAMHLCKQGDGTLILPDVEQSYTGTTTIWAGTLQFSGTMTASPVTLKRFTTLNTNGGTFGNGITMEYGATLNVGGATEGAIGSVTTTALTLNYGARVVLDINGKGDDEHDQLHATSLNLDTDKVGDDIWENFGPQYKSPILELHLRSPLSDGLYPIGNVETVTGDLSKVVIECQNMDVSKLKLYHRNGRLYLQVGEVGLITTAVTTPEPSVVQFPFHVYSLSGQSIKRATSLQCLPKGIYIIDNKRVVMK